ncbi:MAG: hypothetical protein JO142_09300 [Burkholderiales bacterium]|nr:hypothetical protein [Burkholderiales bacterium]
MGWTAWLDTLINHFNTRPLEPVSCSDDVAACVAACDQRKVVRNARARQTLVL